MPVQCVPLRRGARRAVCGSSVSTVVTDEGPGAAASQHGLLDLDIVVRGATRVDRLDDPLHHRKDADEQRERPQRREGDGNGRDRVIQAHGADAHAAIRIRDRDIDDAETDGGDDDGAERYGAQHST